MWVFTTDIPGPSSTDIRNGEALDRVESFLVRPAKVVDEGLPKMIAIGQRLPGNIGHAGVEGIDLRTNRRIVAATFELFAEFRFQKAKDLFCLRPAAAFSFDRLRGFLQEANTLIARPRLHPFECAIDQTHGGQPVKGGIDPAIERDVWRSLIRGSECSIATKDLADRSPSLTAQSRIMMAA